MFWAKDDQERRWGSKGRLGQNTSIKFYVKYTVLIALTNKPTTSSHCYVWLSGGGPGAAAVFSSADSKMQYSLRHRRTIQVRVRGWARQCAAVLTTLTTNLPKVAGRQTPGC